MLWAIAPIDCCQSWGEVGRFFWAYDEGDPNSGHSGVTEILILKFAVEDNESLADFRLDLADPVYSTQDKRSATLAGHRTIRLIEDESRNRHLTYLLKDRASFWVLDFSADRDKFGAFLSLFERGAHSFRLPAAQ